jgi:hypothetical protein
MITQATAVKVADYGTNVALAVSTVACSYVRGLVLENRNASKRYFQLHNLATAPTAGLVPQLSIPVTGISAAIFDEAFFGPIGMKFSVGCSYGWSTTSGTYTAATAADHDTQVISGATSP